MHHMSTTRRRSGVSCLKVYTTSYFTTGTVYTFPLWQILNMTYLMAHFITFQVNNCCILNSNVIWGANLPSGLCALFLGNEYIPLLQLSVLAVWMSGQHPHMHKDLNIEPYGFMLLQNQEEILDNSVVLICQRKIMQVFLHYNLTWAPLWASCSFQRSSLSGNAHKAASECRTLSGSVPAGRAKRRFIASFIWLYIKPCFS